MEKKVFYKDLTIKVEVFCDDPTRLEEYTQRITKDVNKIVMDNLSNHGVKLNDLSIKIFPNHE